MLRGLWKHLPPGLQHKLTIDEFPDVLNVEGDFRVDDAEVLIQLDVHCLQSWDEFLDVDPSLFHLELCATICQVLVSWFKWF